MNGIILRPGETRLAERRAIYRAAAVALVRSGRVAHAAGEHLLPELA